MKTTLLSFESPTRVPHLFFEAIKNGQKNTLEIYGDTYDEMLLLQSTKTGEEMMVAAERSVVYPTFRDYIEEVGYEVVPGASSVEEGIEILEENVELGPSPGFCVAKIEKVDTLKLEKRCEEILSILRRVPLTADQNKINPFLITCWLLHKPDDIRKTPFAFDASQMAYFGKYLSLSLQSLEAMKTFLFVDEQELNKGYHSEEELVPEIIFCFMPLDPDMKIRVKLQYFLDPDDTKEVVAFEKVISDTTFEQLLILFEQKNFGELIVF